MVQSIYWFNFQWTNLDKIYESFTGLPCTCTYILCLLRSSRVRVGPCMRFDVLDRLALVVSTLARRRGNGRCGLDIGLLL